MDVIIPAKIVMPDTKVALFPKGHIGKLGDYFNASEFHCRCKFKDCFYTLISSVHVDRLIWLREKLGVACEITSAFRCQRHNLQVGGEKWSQHCLGQATDVKFEGIRPREVAAAAAECDFDGIGIYDTFTHLDSRGTPARWSGEVFNK